MNFIKGSQVLGEGKFAKVYIATSEIFPGEFAWKELKPAVEPSDRDRFFREVQLLSTLKHRHIVPILDSNLSCEHPYFVMPRARYNLDVAIRYDVANRLDRIHIFRDICKAISYSHSQGIKHRDLKPDNIILDYDDNIWVSDFGLASRTDSLHITITRTNDTGGTALYSAPEQFNSSLREVDERADVYSLGKILYYILTGIHPYQIDDRNDKIPEGLRYIIKRACKHDPEERFPSVAEMIDDFDYALKPRNVTRSVDDEIRAIIEECRISGLSSSESTAAICEAFSNESQNSVFYLTLFPQVPPMIWQQVHSLRPDAFRAIFDKFDQFVSGSLPFDYTDKVANLYKSFFQVINDSQIRETVFLRLVDMGYSHNRFHVRDVAKSLIGSVGNDVELVLGLRDGLSKNKDAARWTLEDVSSQTPHAWSAVFRD